MLLSKRRLRWAAVALLVASGLLLVQPTRVWLQHIWIAGALGPHLTVGEVVYHGQNSIIEVRDLSWQKVRAIDMLGAPSVSSSEPNFTFSARRCWLGIDQQSLVDGRIDLPKVILQDAVITLTSSFPESNVNLVEWRRGVASHLAQFDWLNLKQHVNCLTAIEDLETGCRQRAQDLVERSRGNLTEAVRIEGEAAAMDNPLRFEESIRARLTRYKELSVEQRSLLGQIKNMPVDLTGEIARLEEIHEQDVQALEGVRAQLQNATSADRLALTLDRLLARAIAKASWDQIAPYGEVVANTTLTASAQPAADYNVTVRAGALRKDHIRCSDLKASGEFRFAQFSSPFQTEGSWCVAQQSPGVEFRELSLVTSFDCQTHQLEVTAGHDSRKSPAAQLHIRMLRQQTAKRAQSAATADWPSVDSLAPVTARLISESGTLNGTLRVAVEALPLLSRKLPHDLLAGLQESAKESEKESHSEALEFELSGTWQQPELMLSGAAPVWLQRAVERMMEQQSDEVIAQTLTKFDTDFNQRIEQMREKVLAAAREAQAVVTQDESELLTSQQRLQSRFDEMNGSEFARRAGEVQR